MVDFEQASIPKVKISQQLAARGFYRKAGALYGLIFGICFGAFTWGRDSWILAQNNADLASAKLFVGMPIVILLCVLIGWLSALSSSAPITIMLWGITGGLLGIVAGRMPYDGGNLIAWLQETRLWGEIIFPAGYASMVLMVIVIVVGVCVGFLVGICEVFALDWAWDHATSEGRMGRGSWIALLVCVPLALLYASVVDSQINRPMRDPQMSIGELVRFSIGEKEGNSRIVQESYGAVKPFIEGFTDQYTVHLSEYDPQNLLSGYVDVAFENGLILRCATARIETVSATRHRIITCDDHSLRLSSRIDDLVYTAINGKRRWLAESTAEFIVKDEAIKMLDGYRKNLNDSYQIVDYFQKGGWIFAKIQFENGLEISCRFQGTGFMVVDQCLVDGDTPVVDTPAHKDAADAGSSLPGVSTIPVGELSQEIPWLARESSSLPVSSYIGFDRSAPPFDDPLVRKAFALATDRQLVVLNLIGSYTNRRLPRMTFTLPPSEEVAHYDPAYMDMWRASNVQAYIDSIMLSQLSYQRPRGATSFIPSSVLGRDLYGEVGLHFDPERARELLAQAGYPEGEGFPPVRLPYYATVQQNSIISLIVDTWKTELGVQVILEPLDWDSYQQRVNTSAANLYFRDWFAEYNDPDGFLKPLFHSDQDTEFGLDHSDFDRLLEQATAPNLTPIDRQALYIQAERILCEQETIVIPVIHHYIEY